MEIAKYIAILSLLISALSFWYTYNTKKYELRFQRRNDILSWYEKVVVVLKNIQYKIDSQDPNLDNSLCTLSALIDIGRFFYPNIDKGDDFGANKPLAFCGYRNIVLEFLVYYYNISKKQSAKKYIQHLNILERYFTSFVFKDLNPRHEIDKANSMLRINTTLISLEDFLEGDPGAAEMYLLVTGEDV